MKVQEQATATPATARSVTPAWRHILLHAVVLLLMGTILFYMYAFFMFFDIHDDVAKYQCYAVAFWHGVHALNAFPQVQCLFITHPVTPPLPQSAIVDFLAAHNVPVVLTQFVASQSLTQPFQALPHEYPLLTLIPFSLPLLAPPDWYHGTFALWMVLAAGVTYLLLKIFRSSGAALAFAFYLLIGSWSTAAGRFDIIPALLTLGAVLCADRRKWKWAFALLALATLTKFYPILLLVPFLIGQQKASEGRWYTWRRWMPLLVFVGVCALVEGISLALSVEGTLAPLGYFGSRPIQIESFSATLMWFFSIFGQVLSYGYTFGSLNVFGGAATAISLVGTVLLLVGLLFTWWLQVRGRVDLATATLLSLLIIIFTGKVFSPQYLIWVAPLVAYVGGLNWRWLVSWGLVGLLTTLVYPFVYRMATFIKVATTPPFYPLTSTRNLLLLAVILAILISHARRKQIV